MAKSRAIGLNGHYHRPNPRDKPGVRISTTNSVSGDTARRTYHFRVVALLQGVSLADGDLEHLKAVKHLEILHLPILRGSAYGVAMGMHPGCPFAAQVAPARI